MRRNAMIALVALVGLGIAATANAVPRLQTYIVGATYGNNFLGEEESWVTGANSFDLKVVGAWKGGHGGRVPAMRSIDTYLVIGVLKGETGSVFVNGVELTVFNNVAPLGVTPSVFNHEPVGDMDVRFYHVGNINNRQRAATHYSHHGPEGPYWGNELTLSVEVTDFTYVHFDAVGNDNGSIYKSPHSHDSSYSNPPLMTPEPGTLSLLGVGLLGMIPVLRRKKKNI